VLRDKIVVARKDGVCNYCWQLTIKAKDGSGRSPRSATQDCYLPYLQPLL